MPIVLRCPCGRVLKARDEFAGSRAECPTCGRVVQIPSANQAAPAAEPRFDEAAPTPIEEFLDPPTGSPAQAETATAAAAPATPVLRRMFEALLDPRSIQWMLMIGGGLCVLGVIVWLVSEGVFENKLALAGLLGAGTLAILGAGWYTALRTRFRVAGQALTFLGCVVAPLNLWFYHAQDLLTVDGHLWVGGVICCLLYAATVYVLRDSLFMYAFEAGITLTAMLLLADLGKITDAAWMSLFLMALGLISIHAERAFSPAESAEFPRRKYGLPLFWSGHAQMGVSLLILLASQVLGWFVVPLERTFNFQWSGNLLSEQHLVAAAVWLAAVYAYLYSDIVVRRIGVYLALAGFALVMAEVTLLLGFNVDAEWIIASMAATSLAINLALSRWRNEYPNFERFVPPLGWVLGIIPVLWGVALHWRATSTVAESLGLAHQTSAAFGAVMLATAIANRCSAFLTRRIDARSSMGYFVLSALALLIAAAGLLREFGLVSWSQQAPWMMLIPIGYMIASRLSRGRTSEKPLYWVAQTATGVILLHVFGALVESWDSFIPLEGETRTLLLALVFVEAAVFYALAAVFHRRSINIYLAAVAASGAIWLGLGYYGVPSVYYTMLYAFLGLAGIVAGRMLGLEQTDVYRPGESQAKAIRGRGLAAFQCGTGILCVALIAALMQGLVGLAKREGDWTEIGVLAAMIAAAGFAALVAPAANWRRFYTVAATALAAVTFLRINLEIDLSGWEKLEIFCTIVGVLILAASHVALFRGASGGPTGAHVESNEETVSFGLVLGSVLAATPLLVATLYHRWYGGEPSLWNEIALLTVTIVMLVTGLSWQIKASTLWGGVALVTYLVVLIVSLAYHPNTPVGVYLAVGGATVFALGIALSMYRERLMTLPDRVAKREGVFRILNWR
jgi:hypothetical protein